MSNQPLPAPWLSMHSAPKDGRLVRLLVSFDENAIDDGDEPFATIGQNNFQNDKVDRWQFVGWNWTHDEFTDGQGTPLGWLPMLDGQNLSQILQQYRIALTPEYEGQWHAELFGEESEPIATGEGATPEQAARQAIERLQSGSPEGLNQPQQGGEQ